VYCPAAELRIHNLDLLYPDTELALIEWHMSWPGYDPFYQANPSDNDGRKNFYGVSGVPDEFLDGWLFGAGEVQVNYELGQPSPMTLDIGGSFDTGSGAGSYTITATTDAVVPAGNYKLFAVITEDPTIYGGNNYDTMRKALPNYNGTAITFDGTVGQVITIDGTFDIDPTWVDSNCRLVVWVQDISGQKRVQQVNQAFVADLSTTGITAAPAATFDLGVNYPNPFNPVTSIPVKVSESGSVLLQVIDVQGRVVRTLHQGHLSAGTQNFSWDGTDNSGAAVASGIYMSQLISTLGTQSQRMVLLK
jgi:hypothetical protein